ncbi:MAG: hypothetical protein HYZ49_07630 [Chloroflexi bacterium]|nr:hypothetical protein [Chloroflexota bacterium]
MATSNVLCPQCQTPFKAGDRFCSGCGVDLAVVTLLLEYSAAAKIPSKVSPFLPDTAVPRLGEFLLKRGLLSVAQIQQALDYQQKKKAEAGQSKMLGEALIELGLLTRENLDKAIMAQVMELQAALQASNRQLEERVAERTAEVERALKKVNEVNQLKTDFVSNISHELRTPLARVKGYVYLFADGLIGDLTDEQTEAMEAAAGAVDQLERLIEDLIRFASASRGELVINSAVFCLSDVVHTILNRSDAKATKANVSLASQVPASPVYSSGDEEKLAWVLLQLVDNAVKFTPAGGSVLVTLTTNADQSRVMVAVKDSGIGIPFERMPELFQPFHQLDGSSTRRYGGTGLGLALVHQIIESHDEKVNVESNIGKGSMFSFELPMMKRPA